MKVVIFDGVCNFCNATVNFLLQKDKEGVLRFAANQSETGQGLLHDNGIYTENIETIYFYDEGKLYDKSSAALHIAKNLPFPWKIAYIFIIIPAFIRNFFYQFIAQNRYKWFGKKETCRIPSPTERAKFL